MKTILLAILAFAVLPLQAQEPVIDGKIRDDEWADALVFDKFYMIVPRVESAYHDSTIVYLKQSRDAVFVAIKFWPRGKVISTSLIRDRSTDEENEFFVLLDMENKHQNGYFFAISFLNNQRDLLIYNQRQMSQEWDWVWYNRSTVYRQPENGMPGYIETEIKIPVDKMQNKNKSQIGVDVQLFAYKPDGDSYFYSINPTSELLTLKGTYPFNITPFDERVNFSFNAKPYVVANKFTDSSYSATFGGEFAASLDRQTLKATFNTDESTLEADPFDFSLYRQPIFLQEKRSFFSKDLDIYRTPINLFYTRAIDDIHWGLNHTYRSNSLKTGFTYVREEKPSGSTSGDARSFLALRPNYISQQWNAGALLVYSDDPATGQKDRVVSVDGRLRLGSRWVFVPQYVYSRDGNAYQAYAYYEFNGAGGPYADFFYKRFDKNFSPLTLFNNYGSNNDEVLVSGGYLFRRNSSTFSQINVRAEYYQAQRLTDNFSYQRNSNASVYYKVNDWLTLNHYISVNRPNDENDSGEVITRTNFLQDHSAKFLYGNHALTVGYNFGPFFGSTLHNPYASLDLSFWGRMALSVSYLQQTYAEIDQKIYRIKINYRLLDKLYLRSFYQKDTRFDVAQWNSLIQYEFFAGSNLYFVLNLQGDQQKSSYVFNDRFDYVGRYFKVAYEMNF